MVHQGLHGAPFLQIGIHIIIIPGALAVDVDKPRILEDAQVVGNRRPGKMGALCDLGHAHPHRLVFQQGDKNLLAGFIS